MRTLQLKYGMLGEVIMTNMDAHIVKISVKDIFIYSFWLNKNILQKIFSNVKASKD